MDEADEDAESDAEHGRARDAEFACRFAAAMEGFGTATFESQDFGEEDDVFAVELHAGGVDLETIVIPSKAFVQGFH